MAKAAGRKYLLKKASVTIGGVTALSFKLDATPIEVTDNDSAGLTEYLPVDAGSKQLSIEVSGIYTDNVLRALAISPTADLLLTDLSLVHPGSGAATDTITGNFYMTNYSDNGTKDGPVEFTATFMSSGPWAAT